MVLLRNFMRVMHVKEPISMNFGAQVIRQPIWDHVRHSTHHLMNPSSLSQNKLRFENPPIEVHSYFVCRHRDFECPKWFLGVTDRIGGIGTLHIENDGNRIAAYAETFDGNLIHRDSLYSHWFDAPESTGIRHCAIPELLGELLVFPPQLLLVWALLDINAEATATALAAGADLSRPVLENYYAMDLLSLAVVTRLRQALGFYQRDERDSTRGAGFPQIDHSDHMARASLIRSMLREAGAQDFAPFRNAIGKGDLCLAKTHTLAGIPIDAQSPDGLTPLLSAMFRRDHPALRWLIHEGADASVHVNVPDWLGIEAPESFSAMWNKSSHVSPLAAACAADSPEAFHILLDEAAACFSDDDYQQIIKHAQAPAWAKDALFAGGFTTLPDPVQLSEKDARLTAWIHPQHERQPEEPASFREVFRNSFAKGQDAIGWAEQYAPELLDPPADDPLASVRLVRRWLEASGADPSPLLMEAVEANHPSMVEILLPADPTTMGHALLLAMTHANSITQECDDFCLYRGCITDDIRGKGLPEGYLEVAESIAALLRFHGARDFNLLARASREGDLDKMREEIDGRTPVNFTCDGWGSPLLAAIVGGHLAAVETLLSNGADPNLGFDPGMLDRSDRDYLELPLVTAIRHEKPEILRALMKAGADLHGPQMEKTRMFETGHLSREMAAMLFESPLPLLRNEGGNTCVHLLNEEFLRLCQDLIPTAAWNARNKAGQTPLMNHITSDSPVVSFLLAAGASPNEYSSLDPFQWDRHLSGEARFIALTPLQAAIAAGDYLLHETLLNAGGDLDLPAFCLAPNPSPESFLQLRRLLDDFQPADLPRWERNLWQRDFQEKMKLDSPFHAPATPPSFTQDELSLLCHYLAEDPSRAAHHPDLIIPLSCVDLAKAVNLPLILQTIKAGRKLPAVSFFSVMRDEIDLKIFSYREILRNLDRPDYPKPFVYPYMKEMRLLEFTILLRIWEETGKIPANRHNRDAAMECLRFASAEFFDGFTTAIEHVEENGEASMEDLASVLAENLNPGSTIDLGKFFSNALSNLRRLDQLCDRV